MIKASALLAAVAIGILVAGVIASSLLMVYVSIGVCAVAALILAVGILTHWSEIFGRGDARPASVQEAGSAPRAGAGLPVLASAVSTAVGGWEDPHARHDESAGAPGSEPAEAVRPEQEFPVPGRSDGLWERVEEELGSAAKRDTGALSWPGTELPVVPESPGSPEQAVPPGKAGPRDASSADAGAWIWGSGAGWQHPGLPALPGHHPRRRSRDSPPVQSQLPRTRMTTRLRTAPVQMAPFQTAPGLPIPRRRPVTRSLG